MNTPDQTDSELYLTANEQIRKKAAALSGAMLCYMTSPDAQRTYHDFIYNHYGDFGISDGHDSLAADPAITDGGYTRREYTTFTEMGDLLIIRKRPNRTVTLDPSDFYVGWANVMTGQGGRLFVIDRQEGTEPNWSGIARLVQRTVFGTNPDERKPTAPVAGITSNSLLDALNQKILTRTHDEWFTRYPRLVRSGTGGYFSHDGIAIDVPQGDIRYFQHQIEQLQPSFGQMATLSTVEVAEVREPATIAG